RIAVAFHLNAPTPLGATAILLAAMSLCAFTGFILERFAYRPLRRAPRLNVLITAIGVSLFIENVGQLPWAFGKNVQQFPPLVADHTFTLGGVNVRLVEVITVGAALVLMVGLNLLVYRSKIGRAMRAVSIDHNVAGLMGVPVDRIISFTFIVGSALAAAAG